MDPKDSLAQELKKISSQEAPISLSSSASSFSAVGGLVGGGPPSPVRTISRSYIWVAGEDRKEELSVISACSSPEPLGHSLKGDLSDSLSAAPSVTVESSHSHKLPKEAHTLDASAYAQLHISQRSSPEALGNDEDSNLEPPDLYERQLSSGSSLMLSRSEMDELERISLSSSCFSYISEMSLSSVRTSPESSPDIKDLKKGAPPSPLMMPLSGPSQHPGFQNIVSNAFSRDDSSSAVRILRAVSSHSGSEIFEEIVGADEEADLTTPTFAQRPENEQDQEPTGENNAPHSPGWYETFISKCISGWEFIRSYTLIQCRVVRDEYKASPESFRSKVLLGAIGCVMVYKVGCDLIDKLG